MRRVYWLGLIFLMMAMILVACGGAEEPTGSGQSENQSGTATEEAVEGEVFKVAFVYVAPIGDLGWTWAHDQGRLAIEEEFGDKVETTFIELVAEGPDSERVIRDFAQKGYDLIFTTSFGYMDPTETVATEFPETWFVHISGFKQADNMSNVFGRMYIPRYLSGIAAGAATESNVIGYVAAFPIPEVVRGMNAFTLGVRAINPNAEVRVVYTNTWFGPPEEREAAQALLDQGADVIAQHQDTTEPQKAAQEAGKVSIGYDSDMREFVGDSVLTSPIWNWGPKYVDIVRQIMDGTYQSESYWDAEITALAPFSPQMDARIVDMIQEQELAIRGGKAEVFCGPITSNTGILLVEEGNCLTDGEMLSMEWYVEGIVADAPGEATEGLGEASDLVPAARISQ